jgi:hypothetical protein
MKFSGGVLFGYDVGVISGAKVQVAHEMELSCGQEEALVCSFLFSFPSQPINQSTVMLAIPVSVQYLLEVKTILTLYIIIVPVSHEMFLTLFTVFEKLKEFKCKTILLRNVNSISLPIIHYTQSYCYALIDLPRNF